MVLSVSSGVEAARMNSVTTALESVQMDAEIISKETAVMVRL